MLAATALSRRFGKRTVVDDVSLTVNRSEIVALLGPNGAGKTTTLRMLAGLIGPTQGSVTIDGVPLTRATGTTLRRHIGFLPEAPGLWDRLTVLENLRVYARLYALERPDKRIGTLLEVLGLSGHEGARAAELSKGMRQKVALARALLHDPAVLLLDEPTSGLDPRSARTVRRLLDERRAAGCAVIVSTHNLDEAERLSDRVAVLQQRLIALDTPSALRRRLATNRIVVRVAGPAAEALVAVRAFDPAASANGQMIELTLAEAESATPAVLRSLIDAGIDVVEVRPEVPALEDVYLHLMGADNAERRLA